MANTFVVSDHHIGHEKTWSTFKKTGTDIPLRPFTSTEEMNEYMIQEHNKLVKPEDRVYFLGDFSIARRNIQMAQRFNGRKVLVKGNHDIFKLEDYTPWFEDIRAYHVLDNIILCHIPIHPLSKGRFRANVHGHLHDNIVPNDPWYINVCVERTDFKPVAFEDIRKYVSEKIEKVR